MSFATKLLRRAGGCRTILLSLTLCGALLAAPTRAASQPAKPVHCLACDQGPLTGRYWKNELGAICEDCHRLERRCWICGRPAAKDYIKTPDGRYICRREARNAIIGKQAVQQTFQSTRIAIKRMTRGYMTLKSPEINVEVFSQPVWDPDGTKSALHRQGLATTRQVGKTYHHNVMLISGLVNTNLIGVSAHEFTHLWINENKGDHQLDPLTNEAICEMVAYKLAETYRHHNYMKLIRENTYTQGRAAELLPLVERYGLKSLLRWVIEGSGPNPSSHELASLRAYRPAATVATQSATPSKASPLYQSTPRAAPMKPDSLELKGVIGAPGKYTALISGVMFREGESRTIRLQDKSVTAHCQNITRNSAVLKLEGVDAPVKLQLR